MNLFFWKKTAPVEAVAAPVPHDEKEQQRIAAVIALALHSYNMELREYEKAVITIKKSMVPYSPWSSKIYGLRQWPQHRPGLRMK